MPGMVELGLERAVAVLERARSEGKVIAYAVEGAEPREQAVGAQGEQRGEPA